MDKILVVSSDCHAGIPTMDYKPYLEAKYHSQLDDFDRWLREAHLDGKTYYEQPVILPSDLAAEREGVSRVANFTDSEGRLRDLEKDGVVTEVMYPGAAPSTRVPWSDFLSAGSFRTRTPAARVLQAAGERAYNRWLAEFCTAVPKDRRLGLHLPPYHDMEAAVKDIEWAAKAGLRGIVLPFFTYDMPEYTTKYWDPIWAICQETGFTVNFHGGNGTPEMGERRYLWMIEHLFWPKRTIAQMIFSGVFDRFPKLRCTLTEAHAGWIPDALGEFDKLFTGLSSGTKSVNNAMIGDGKGMPDRLPSEYWFENWYTGVGILEREEMEKRHEIGIRTMMYGVDYPHPEGSWGSASWWLSLAFGDAGVTEEEARLILGENLARLYNLDRKALEPVVQRVGPTIEQLNLKIGDEERERVFEEARATGRGFAPGFYERRSTSVV